MSGIYEAYVAGIRRDFVLFAFTGYILLSHIINGSAIKENLRIRGLHY